MKKIKYITIFIFTLLSISSCKYDDNNYYYNYDNDKKTSAAKLVYDETEGTIKRYLEVLNLSQTIDAYLHSKDKIRDSIKYFHLSGFDILENGDSVYVKNNGQNEAWTIIRNSSNSLDTPSTEWSVEGNCMFLKIPKNGFLITTQPTANTWHIKVVDLYSDISNPSNIINKAHLNVQMIPDKKYSRSLTNDYIITMAGETAGEINATTGDMFNTSFKITSPIETRKAHFVKGKIEMKVERNYSTKDSITAEIRGDGQHIEISFRGVTEMWRW